ncbi:YihY family inner membrane protein [Paramagnetospirillum magnetotacticum]|uniref:YihY family inner membrane protein n=1 Tax=Paramagnetospirillum magnetotacticum TaxID=188 RepID=UPI0005976F11|nr:YihY family inner membrane protein [Paramagnetospirillum magnetotacticum]
MKNVLSDTVRNLPTALSRSIRRFSTDEVLVRASSLAFASMLSMVPVAAVSLVIFSSFPEFIAYASHLKGLIIRTFLPGIGGVLESHIDEFIANASSLSIIGICSLMSSSAFLMFEIRSTFSRIFGSFPRSSVAERIFELIAFLTSGPIAIAGVGWGAAMILERYGVDLGAISASWQSYGIAFGAFFLILVICSPRGTSVTACLVGSVVGCTVYSLAQFAFIKYISLPVLPNLIYGAMAIIPLLQMWLLVLWVIIILSATLAAELSAGEIANRID